MELFNKRYICFICFAFVITALLLTMFPSIAKIVVGAVASLVFVAFLTVFLKVKKHKFNALFTFLLAFSVALSAFSSYFFVSLPQNKAEDLLGQDTVLVKIVAKSGDGRYETRLLRVGDEDVNVKSELFFESEETFKYGDELILNAEISIANDHSDRSKLISLDIIDGSEVYFNKAETANYFSRDGIMSLCYSLQSKFSSHVDRVFGDYGALAKGLLVNDTSDIDVKTNTNFNRSGTSHILAVSGTHVVLLMGALELLLRKIHVKKEIRIAIISIFALFFLALCGFVASAVRSVLMLYAVYLCYVLYEENDSITALFVSIAIIILFSPFSVYDLGMWMSFLATLGILSAYAYFSERMPYPKHENLFLRYSLRFLILIAKTLMLTIVANFFLLPIMWYVFGSISLSAVPCNLILSPIVTVLMPLCAISTLLGFIPYVSIPFVFVTKKLFDLMMAIVGYFAEIRFGVVSLQFEFAKILVIIFAVTMIVLLVIKLNHKFVIFIPMASFAIIFAVCIAIFNYTSAPNAQCVKTYSSEVIFVNDGTECNVVDYGKGTFAKGKTVAKYMSKYATEIDKYFIVSPDANHTKTLERVCENTIIRTLYLPKTIENKDISAYAEILKCAEKYNIPIKLYENYIGVEICNSVLFYYSSLDGFSLNSQNVTLKKLGNKTICEYQENLYEVEYNKYFSEIIPLN